MNSNKFNKLYEGIVNPLHIIRYFDTLEEFDEWLSLGTKDDLLKTIKAFEDVELYEVCSLIQTYIKENNIT